jgi:hypothetical protein
MAQVYETGHPKNVANLLQFNQLIATFVPTYNPANPAITVGGLTTLFTNSNTRQNNVNNAFNAMKNATNNRELAFEAATKLSTKLLGALQSSATNQQTIDDLAAIVHKMRGDGRAGKEEEENQDQNIQAIPNPIPIPPVTPTKSTSQQGFDNKLSNFSKMILLLQSIPAYNPNEVAYQIAALQAQLANLTNLNNLANTSYANLTAMRISRNTFFYQKETGMLDIVKKSKAYIKSIFGANSQQYKAANAIKFVRVVPKKKAN